MNIKRIAPKITMLVTLFVLLVVISHSQQNKKNSTEAENGKNTSPNITAVVKQENPPHVEDREKQNEEESKIQNKLTNFTGYLVVVGVLQALVLGFTAWLIKRQADQMVQAGEQTERIITQMKESEVRDLRAYVGVSKVVLNLQKDDTPRGIVEIQNFGKTPAYKVRQWIGIAIHSHPLTIPLPESSRPKVASAAVIFPGIKNVSLVDLKKPLPPSTVIGTPQLTVYVFGGVIYDDAFGNERRSNYRFIFGGPEGGQVYRDDKAALFGTMNPDSEGNEST